NTASAVGERQILPRQTNRTFTLMLPTDRGHAVDLQLYQPRPAALRWHRLHESAGRAKAHAAAPDTRYFPASRVPRLRSRPESPPGRHRFRYDGDRARRSEAQHGPARSRPAPKAMAHG